MSGATRLLLGALLAAISAPAAGAQDLGTLESPPFVGTWWAVDAPLGQARVLRFEDDGTALMLDGSLEAARYEVGGDSVRIGGGGVAVLSRGTDVHPYRIRSDTLWYGYDEVPKIRAGGPRAASNPLLGRWMYGRHGRAFIMEFTRDGRLIRWQVAPPATWEPAGPDSLVIRAGPLRRRHEWTVVGDLLTLSGDEGAGRLLRIEDPTSIPLAPLGSTDPTLASCEAIRAVAERFLQEGRMATYGDDLGLWGFLEYEADQMRLWKETMSDDVILAHTTAHLAAHAVGYGTTPDTEWMAEEVARRCTE